jgi:hypothetical protein
MGISEQPSRPKLLAGLAGFVVVFGVTAWLVTGGATVRIAPPSHSHPPGVTAAPLDCLSSEIKLVGAFNECASIDRTSYTMCAVTPHAFSTVFKLLGPGHDFPLYLNSYNTYPEPGDYSLTTGGADVEIREYATGDFWQSVSGVLAVTSSDGRSGTVSAILEASTNDNPGFVVPSRRLAVDGRWSCP